MKTADNHFRGFPGLWNAAAFYFILLMPPAWLVLSFRCFAVVATFLDFPFIHPLRVENGRSINIAILVIWGLLALVP